MDGLYVTLEAAEEGLGHGRLHLDTFVQVLQGYDVELDEGDWVRGRGGRAKQSDRESGLGMREGDLGLSFLLCCDTCRRD